ncbi:MAG: hypothetical protein WBX01_17335 [Nitrososphaeraceae archaeon]
MIDYQKHFDKFQKALAKKNASGKNCVDEIDEQLWKDEIIKVLDEISINAADELQKETQRPYPKDTTYRNPTTNEIIVFKTIQDLEKVAGKLEPGAEPLRANGKIIGFRRNLKYSEAPPTRLLSFTLNLCYWLGFLDASNNHELHEEGGIGAWKRIDEAYKMGKVSHPNSV